MKQRWRCFLRRHAVFYSQMCSVMGHNVQYFCEHFGVCSFDVIDSSKQWKLMADFVYLVYNFCINNNNNNNKVLMG